MEDRAYTKGQVFWGSFLGGPLAALYFLRANFLTKLDFERAQKTVLYGLLCFAALIFLIPFVPENVPGVVFSLAYAFGARAFYEQYQTSMQDRPRFSNWRVTGYALLLCIPTVIAILAVVFLYDRLGLIDLDAPAE